MSCEDDTYLSLSSPFVHVTLGCRLEPNNLDVGPAISKWHFILTWHPRVGRGWLTPPAGYINLGDARNPKDQYNITCD